jgi:CheY-like chemotaxis protein
VRAILIHGSVSWQQFHVGYFTNEVSLMAVSRCVLVVDDIPSNRMVARAMLERQGWTVLTASDGREALETLAATSCDLVLLDISMPGMSGIEVCQNIRANVALAGLPVIAYTAHAQPEDRRNFIASGFDEVLIKPVSSEKLANAVAAVTQNRGGNLSQ